MVLAQDDVCVLIFASFFEEVRRLAAPDYIPNEADVLRARTKTTGIYETRFTMGQLSIQSVVMTWFVLLSSTLADEL
jgi:hypothetical protein